MARSPTGVIPEDLMDATKRSEVLAYLFGLAIPGLVKAELYGGWLRVTGATVLPGEIQYLIKSGVDRPPAVVLPSPSL